LTNSGPTQNIKNRIIKWVKSK